MKKEARSNVLEKMLEDLPRRVIDPNSVTISELSAEVGMGIFWTSRHASRMVEDGKWERVFKHNGRKVVPAYRPVAK